jgi:hypothetical protein
MMTHGQAMHGETTFDPLRLYRTESEARDFARRRAAHYGTTCKHAITVGAIEKAVYRAQLAFRWACEVHPSFRQEK